jgi:hypothetical protein
MATLRAHGKEIGRLEFPAYRLAIMSDGHILKDEGWGWKVYKKVKAGITPQGYLDRRVANQKAFLAARPETAHFQAEMGKLAVKMRSRIVGLFNLLGDDADGIWSELDDWTETRNYFSFEEVARLSRMYKAAVAECKRVDAENKTADAQE